ncbi:MAG: UDP-N-acetylmuramoyl-L-alanyl-D-glutamate--2,6-diaminopimelate ligase [Bacteroidia bacterium]
MKKLNALIAELEIKRIVGDDNVAVDHLSLDSREIRTAGLFAALSGSQVDGHDYIGKAIDMGASVILCERIPEGVSAKCFVVVEDSSIALGFIASAFYGRPSVDMAVVGITGTNGKTSIATMLYESFASMGYKVGLLSTIKYAINGTDYTSTHTTPNAIRIQELLAEMKAGGCDYAFMEVSSHAIDQNRIAGINFRGGVFTNITHDHLDYHKDFKSYLYTKKKFFDQLPADAFALYNRDDKNGQIMVQNTKASRYSYSLNSVSDFKTKIIEHDLAGMLLDLRGDEVWMRLVGKFNAYNVLAVYATSFLLNIDHIKVITALSELQSVEGRFQHLQYKGVTAIVDYAHTPDALRNVLDTINAIRTKNEQLICVVGCGGNRDTAKRPIMAEIAAKLSNKVILTSDNPRNESPDEIIKEMMSGIGASHIKKVLKITDREEAIKAAISLADSGDVILVAGKGHEKYQEVKGVKHPFDDKEVLIRNLKLIQE